MIKLFKDTDTVYTTNGDVVINPTKCRVNNADGGEFKLSLTCPISYSKYIENNYIIVVPTPAGEQPFRIYEIEKSQNKIDLKARHITYDSMEYVIADSYAVGKTCLEAMVHFNNATDNASPFTMRSDITTVDNLRIVRKSLYEALNEVNERWGGHIVRDMFTISNLSTIGRDNGITIEYRKNLQSITASYDFSGVCTKCLPVGKDGTLLDNLYVYSSVQYDTPHTKVIEFEQDIERDDYPTEAAYIAALKADLYTQATNYVNTYCYPSVNYSLKGKPEKVTDIGDIIKVKDERLGIDILTQVISYEFDCITETYKSLEFGNFTNSLSNLIGNISKETTDTVNKAIQSLPSQSEATEESSGLMSAADKRKLDGIESGAEKNKVESVNSKVGEVVIGKIDVGLGNVPNVTTDDQTPTFTEASTRANIASGEKLSVLFGKIKKYFTDLKTVAFSGSYNDLTDKPSIPSGQIQSDWTQTNTSAVDYIKNKPTIPTVNDKTITLQLNGTSVGDFTLNQSSDETINYQITKTDVGLGNVGNFKAVSTEANQELNTTEQSNARANIGAGTSSFSGNYNDLSNKPSLAAVATSGSYTDLSNTPTIPTVSDKTITIKVNNTTVDSFTLNQSSAKDIDISVPTKTSDLTNDSGYITSYTDEKVTAENVSPTSETAYRLLMVPNATPSTNQKPKENSFFKIYLKNGSTSVEGYNYLILGNDTASGTANNQYGVLRLYARTAYRADLYATSNLTANRNIGLPDKDGTIAITSDLSSYLSLAGGTMTGTLKFTENSVSINFRPSNNDYSTTISHQTTGNEALVFASKQANTSFMFVNGEDSVNNHESDRWKYLTPGLQIKNNKVAIGKLIANGTNLTYALEVNGDVQATNFRGALIGNADTATKASQNASGTAFGDLATINKGSGSSKFLREDGTWQTVTATWSGGTVTSNILPSGTVNIGASNKVFSQVYAKIINATQTVFVGSENYMRGYVGFRQNNSAYSHYLYANGIALTSDKLCYMPTTGGTLVTDNTCKVGKLLNYLCAALNTDYTTNLSEAYTNYDLIVMTSYQHTGGVSTTGRVGGAACIVPTALAYASNTAYTHQVQNFGAVYFPSTTTVKVRCTTNVAYGILIFGIKFGSTPSSW